MVDPNELEKRLKMLESRVAFLETLLFGGGLSMDRHEFIEKYRPQIEWLMSIRPDLTDLRDKFESYLALLREAGVKSYEEFKRKFKLSR